MTHKQESIEICLKTIESIKPGNTMVSQLECANNIHKALSDLYDKGMIAGHTIQTKDESKGSL